MERKKRDLIETECIVNDYFYNRNLTKKLSNLVKLKKNQQYQRQKIIQTHSKMKLKLINYYYR